MPGRAWPHAALLASEPADGASLDTQPATVVLHFDEGVTPIALHLVGPDGAAVTLGAVEVGGRSLRAAIRQELSPGTYLLSWRVTSADSHPVAGAVAFGLRVDPSATAPREAVATGTWLDTLPSQAVRWAFTAALMTAAGGALFRALVAEIAAPLRRGLTRLAMLGVTLAVLQLGLRGALLNGTGPAAVLAAESWRLAASTTLATSLIVSGLGLVGCSLAMRRAGTAWRRVGSLAALVALLGIPLSGHAATAEPRWLTAPALALHTLAVAFWLGAFAPLIALLRGPLPEALRAVRRFSALAIPAVLVLACTGTLIAAVQVQAASNLVATTYGLLLLIKLTGVATMVVLAGWNRQYLVPALQARDGSAPGQLRRSVMVEFAVGALVLAVTSVLTLTAPPRAEHHVENADQGDRPAPHRTDAVAVATETNGVQAVVEVTPGRAGRNRLAVTLRQATGAPLAPVEVSAVLSQDQAGIGPIRRPLVLDETGVYAWQGPDLAIPGRWRIEVEILVTDFSQISLSTQVDIR